jgi:hypothetical protein
MSGAWVKGSQRKRIQGYSSDLIAASEIAALFTWISNRSTLFIA